VAPPRPDAVLEADVEYAGDHAGVEVVCGEVALSVFVGGHDQDDAFGKHGFSAIERWRSATPGATGLGPLSKSW